MPHGHGVDNCRLTFCRKGRQLDLEESRIQISDSDFPAESAARFPPILGVCVRIRSGADGVGDGDHNTRST